MAVRTPYAAGSWRRWMCAAAAVLFLANCLHARLHILEEAHASGAGARPPPMEQEIAPEDADHEHPSHTPHSALDHLSPAILLGISGIHELSSSLTKDHAVLPVSPHSCGASTPRARAPPEERPRAPFRSAHRSCRSVRAPPGA